jgi:hypothetical protein
VHWLEFGVRLGSPTLGEQQPADVAALGHVRPQLADRSRQLLDVLPAANIASMLWPGVWSSWNRR